MGEPMTTKQTTAAAVAALYTAAGRNYAETELSLYHNALTGLDDDDVAQAVADIVRSVDLGQRPPSPALVMETIRDNKRRAALENQPLGLPEPSKTPQQVDRVKQIIEETREKLRGTKA